ncbi:hypothetical protein KY285_022597 [Solanum tuberosum]|nr:hypothetical protein KY285_022597 [Solanum tuberosum]
MDRAKFGWIIKPLYIPKDSILKQKSPAEFFADNKNIAGFDNPGKCLYTTVRELVENALDSAESISELPVVEITIEEVGRSKFNSMIGLADHERRYEASYDDFETAKARKKNLAKEARVLEIQARNVALGKNALIWSKMKSRLSLKGTGQCTECVVLE